MSRFSTDGTVQIKRMMWEMGAASGPKGQLVAGAIPKLVRRGLVAVEREGGGGCRNPKSTPPPCGLVRQTRVREVLSEQIWEEGGGLGRGAGQLDVSGHHVEALQFGGTYVQRWP